MSRNWRDLSKVVVSFRGIPRRVEDQDYGNMEVRMWNEKLANQVLRSYRKRVWMR